MGIQGFATFFKDCFEERNFNDYRGNRVAVDALFQIYKYVIAIRNNGEDLVNSKGKTVSHFYAIFSFAMFLLRHGLIPIFLWDHKAPDIKKLTLDDRRKHKQKAIQACKSINDKTSDEYIKHYKRSFVLKEKHIQDCQRLLTAMGIPYQQCIGEADPQCAALSCDDTVLGVIGEDTDIIVFGTKLLLRDFSGKKKKVKELSMYKILSHLQEKANRILIDHGLMDPNDENNQLYFTHENFVDFSILMGTDYTPHIKGYTNEELFKFFVLSHMNIPQTIMSLIADIEQKRVLGNQFHQYIVPYNFIEEWYKAKQYYMDAQVIHPAAINKNMVRPNKEEIMKIMCEENDFDEDCVSDMVDELDDMYLAFKGVQKSNNGFKSFKSYQLKFQYMKHGRNKAKSRHHKLILRAKPNENTVYDIHHYDLPDDIYTYSNYEPDIEYDMSTSSFGSRISSSNGHIFMQELNA
jgi:flap endonuclease-1